MSTLIIAMALDTPSRKRELLAAALAAQGAAASPIVLVNTGQAHADDAAMAAGMASVYQLAAPLVGEVANDALLDVITQACQRFNPRLLLLMGDDCGVEIGARLAVRLDAACISGCSRFECAQDGALHYVRSVFGGRALETLASTSALTIACIKPKAFDTAALAARTTAAVPAAQALSLAPAPAQSAVTRVEVINTQHSGAVNLEDAAMIVSGGRGVGGEQGFAQLKQLAQALGGALGASRAAVDLGWISSAHQVGQTGKTVAPEVYLAIGISGAMQHLAGISAARRVVAINSDDQAPIFSVADVGVVGDAGVLVPALLDALKVF